MRWASSRTTRNHCTLCSTDCDRSTTSAPWSSSSAGSGRRFGGGCFSPVSGQNSCDDSGKSHTLQMSGFVSLLFFFLAVLESTLASSSSSLSSLSSSLSDVATAELSSSSSLSYSSSDDESSSSSSSSLEVPLRRAFSQRPRALRPASAISSRYMPMGPTTPRFSGAAAATCSSSSAAPPSSSESAPSEVDGDFTWARLPRGDAFFAAGFGFALDFDAADFFGAGAGFFVFLAAFESDATTSTSLSSLSTHSSHSDDSSSSLSDAAAARVPLRPLAGGAFLPLPRAELAFDDDATDDVAALRFAAGFFLPVDTGALAVAVFAARFVAAFFVPFLDFAPASSLSSSSSMSLSATSTRKVLRPFLIVDFFCTLLRFSEPPPFSRFMSFAVRFASGPQ
mmetsp:Transcript_26567/g.82113  ORF Transcript_26567/g.82113 Transcript_26567/m.82113 type:complete len:395 (-) Transcript_26567:988-2172(-)